MMETKKGKRIEQILATNVTREELAEALWCAEGSVRMWHECADALRCKNAKLRELCASLYEFAMSEYPDGTELNFADRTRELGIEV